MRDDPRRVDVGEAERAHAGGVDDPPVVVGQGEGDRRARGVPAAPGDVVDHADGAQGVRDEGVDDRRLADAGVPDEHADPPGERVTHRVEPDDRAARATRGDDVAHRERRVLLEERCGVGDVGLGQQEQGLHAGVEGGDEAAVDEAGAGFGVGQGGDDDELVGVGHEHPLDGVGVVGGAAQHGDAGGDPHDPGQAALGTGGVADEVHLVTHDDALATELAGPHRRDVLPGSGLADEDPVAAAVDAEDPGGHRVGVYRPLLGAGPGPAPVGADADVGLVVVARGPRHQASAVARSWSIRSQRLVNSGIVLATVPTSSTTTPGTASPSTAPAITIRWSW